MATTLAVPKDYGYVVLAAAASIGLGFWHAGRTGPFRRTAGVPHPIPYALEHTDDAAQAQKNYLFNCAQRAHANFLENLVHFFPSLLIAGLKFPRVTAGLGGIWLVSRILYATGFTDPTQKNGKGRWRGWMYIPVEVALFSMMGMVGWDLLKV